MLQCIKGANEQNTDMVGKVCDVQTGPSLAPIYDRQGKPTSYIQIKPVAQSCSGIIKGQSEVLKLLAHSSVNYTASIISAIITGLCKWNYSGKIFEDL
jgi:hypothetical protein